MTSAAFTWTERALLLATDSVVYDFLCWPKSGTERRREGTRSGGGHGFDFRCTTTAVVGEWRTVRVVERYPNSEAKRLEFGELIGDARVSYRRLQRWGESMPAAVREWAQTWDTVLPEDTRDPIALTALVLSLLLDPSLVPALKREPVDLLELLEMTNA